MGKKPWKPLVRPAALDDDADLLALDTASWTPGSGFPSAQQAERTTYFTERRTPQAHLVAELGDQIVGTIGVHPKTRFPETAHVMAVTGLVVSADARRLGVASALLASAEQRAASLGARKLSLQVLGSNTGALSLYEDHGYTVEGRFRDEVLIGDHYIDDISMSKNLRG
ncbi:N-acetyltransferase family protein [Actinoallomurus sp. CA-142502]|uniref:GNAT family N-acetyltransferase n=1 Tax=Actinoallomurus sp. CA-142502 TaxID=3239885 RepID=UPI003D948146